ncbi:MULTISPECIES: response regulator [Sporomusa]|jgi:two-component system alkaline phosphatase synthesis response regulator PhoP|uniref:Alkaline phosphatase synthesis transcriptional regulatory protein PhoP n=1 Tax=Sporomusa sphaeroides DSM 2875 TaxID=1337886 RepID=A0ABM9W0S0_9FIRM|nr:MULTISPECIES: response regulator transcription factor [Sporomusa]MCM0758763.1 response regulator transcription factor [Sporomusa sphaeroides DSM 2875]OLS56810.1 alkaline phosphatase synthesis transcriptional regulatory protein PhoP [Sporomusa sphaeroides DSM 2875]CVK18757.1 Alkaline phosphatase synthesis transcriptional regulatory protein PhoP [Sporomusa sphaeroides DSM 2875]
MAGKILVIDDELNIRELIKFNVEKAGYKVLEADNGQTAVAVTKAEQPDLVVLDLMLPGMDGLEVCRIIKNSRETAAIPIIMLTAKNEEIDKILGLELGADDYLTKPFSPRELVARIKAVLRRSHKDNVAGGELVIGKLKLNFSRYEAYLGTVKLELTPKEYEMLKLFVTNTGKVFTREQLLEKVWGYEYFGDTRTVDVHVRHLRVKLGQDNEVAEAIETVRGVGYRFKDL